MGGKFKMNESSNNQKGTAHEVTANLFAGLSGRYCPASADKQLTDPPLVIAIHGGTYTSAYFDIPGHSLLDLAESIGIPVLAIDRPGYGASAPLAGEGSSIQGQAKFLTTALKEAWTQYGASTRGIVLIGHSIGGAIAISIAAQAGADLPIIGLAISGVGLRVPAHFPAMWASFPDGPVEFPVPLKDEVMFGPAGSFVDSMPAASHVSDAAAPRQEIIDIVTTWIEGVRGIVGRVRVPVHYRQAEFDKLWIVDESEVKQFGEAFTSSPSVDAALVKDTGHCMDFHRIGTALQVQQLGFSLQCAVEATGSKA
jgi:pimeloyl-ACP methyl ester carboxylesterase